MKPAGASPARHLERELRALRSELRATIRAYAAKLEIDLAESTAAIAAAPPPDSLSREQIHEFRDLVALLRKRKLKPLKGRRKDLRKLDSLISEVYSSTHPKE